MPLRSPLHAVTSDRRVARPSNPYNSVGWRKERNAQLDAFPYCVSCGGPASVADHVTPLRHGGTKLQSMCGRCHNIKRATTDKRPAVRV